MDQATKCVYEAFDWPLRARWLLMMRRFSSSTLTGMLRTEVAVGTPSDASMLVTILAAAPRRGVAPGTSGGTGVGRVAAAASAAGGTTAGAAVATRSSPSVDRKSTRLNSSH